MLIIFPESSQFFFNNQISIRASISPTKIIKNPRSSILITTINNKMVIAAITETFKLRKHYNKTMIIHIEIRNTFYLNTHMTQTIAQHPLKKF